MSRDELLTNITFYWATGAIGSSFWPFTARAHSPWPIPQGARIAAPTGYAQFPKEILRPPRSVAERTYANIQRWTEMKGAGISRRSNSPRLLRKNTGVLQAAPLDRFAGSRLGRSKANPHNDYAAPSILPGQASRSVNKLTPGMKKPTEL